MAKIYFL